MVLDMTVQVWYSLYSIREIDMALYRRIFFMVFISFISLLFTCGSTPTRESREKDILKNYDEGKKTAYSDLLVDEIRYTTSGGVYHRKYYRHLIGIAGDISENKKLKVSKGSIGFYYDRKSKNRDSLYLGLDIESGKEMTAEYERSAIELLNEYLRDVISTIYSCKSIFDEKDIVGMVVGIKWTRNGSAEMVNIWIDKRDVLKYEDSMLTFDELLMRNTVTNTEGKIFRLPL